MHRSILVVAIAALTASQASAVDSVAPSDSAESYLNTPQQPNLIQQVSCQSGYCDQGCTGCGEGCLECCEPFWAHKHKIFGEWLFLSPRQQAVDYATPVDGTTNTAVPVGPTSVVDIGFNSGFRVGGAVAIDECSSLTFAWTNYQSSEESQSTLPGGAPQPNSFLRSDLVHPNTVDVATDSLFASAIYDIDFVNADAAFTKTLLGDCGHRLNGSVGFRYGGLQQDLTGQHQILNNTTVQTDIEFNGYGPRFALDYERQNCTGLLMYCRGGLSLLMGNFNAEYQQTSVFAGQQAAAGITESRIVPQYELELGTGWESAGGGFRVTAGYLFSAWGNVLTTPGFIDGVQANELDDIDETLTFDGLALRAEVLF